MNLQELKAYRAHRKVQRTKIAEKDVVLLRIAENIRFTRHCLRVSETEG